MIQVSLKISEIKKNLDLFKVDASIHLTEEVAQAILGEVNHNGMEYNFDGLIERK